MHQPQTTANGDRAARAALGTEQMLAMIVQCYWTIYDEAISAFRLSQQDREVRTVEESDKEGAKSKRVSVRSENRPGTPTLLAKALDALKAIRQILGLDAPRRGQTPSQSGKPALLKALEDYCLNDLTSEELGALETELNEKIRLIDEQMRIKEIRLAKAAKSHDSPQAEPPGEETIARQDARNVVGQAFQPDNAGQSQAGKPDLLCILAGCCEETPPTDGEETASGDGSPKSAADAPSAAPARQERPAAPPLANAQGGPQSPPVADRQATPPRAYRESPPKPVPLEDPVSFLYSLFGARAPGSVEGNDAGHTGPPQARVL